MLSCGIFNDKYSMKLIKSNIEIELSAYIKQAEIILKKEKIYIIDSLDPVIHTAAYIAWRNVGGNILVLPPLKDSIKIHVKVELEKILPTLFNSVVFLSSGTTGAPKLIVQSHRQFDQMIKMSAAALNWEASARVVCLNPVFTVGYWYIVLPAAVLYKSTISVSSVDNIHTEIIKPGDQLIASSGQLDLIQYRNALSDYSVFSKILTGSSKTLPKLYNHIFSHGGKSVTHGYGSTEIGAPILSREVFSTDSAYEYLEILPKSDAEFKLINNELYVKGESLCTNYKDYDYDNEWFRTHDIWEEHPTLPNLFQFFSRTNDIVKVNGQHCNLLQLEIFIEENTNLGECLAVVRNSMGVEWIEILYTNSSVKIDRTALNKLCSTYVDRNCTPKKYTVTEYIPKAALQKKIR